VIVRTTCESWTKVGNVNFRIPRGFVGTNVVLLSAELTKEKLVINVPATILTAMGISPKTVFEIEKGLFCVTEDGNWQPVNARFA
jgi:hypothetical protein